jgi:hypothetical protein
MSQDRQAALREQRKALLMAKAGIDRVQLASALHDIGDQVRPKAVLQGAVGRSGMLASAVLALGIPLLGRTRLSRTLKTVSIAMTALRLLKNWRNLRD